MSSRGNPRVLVAHPSVELYGADRMLLQSARALADAGCDVSVALPGSGELAHELRRAGLRVVQCPVPVLRKGALSPRGLLQLVLLALRSLPQQLSLVRHSDVVYVNTITVPTWVAAGRLLRRRVVVHVHEAEQDAAAVLRWALLLPLLAARLAVCNSRATEQFVRGWGLGRRVRTQVVHNGMVLPTSVAPPPPGPALRLALVGRLSPRKGQDVALAAMALLQREGLATSLVLAGDVFEGYEWFAQDLRAAARDLDVEFLGFVHDPGPVYAAADVVLVPSRVEPFGNVAVEGLAAARPVVASAVQGLVEVLEEGGGLIVPADDPRALAKAIRTLSELPAAEREALGAAGRAQVLRRFSPERYAAELVAAVLGADGRVVATS